MRTAYPIVISRSKDHFIVFIPDFQINSQGKDIAQAMEMARDAIGLIWIDMEDEKEPLPNPSELAQIAKEYPSDIVTLVDVDFYEYRRKNDMRTVKKNCTIPSWLNFKAEQAGINFSQALQDGLKQQLHL